MVTVDMSTARTQITKRQRRMRRAAHRRLQKEHKAKVRALRALEVARQARRRAITAWHAEEDRLQRLKDAEQSPPDKKSHNGPTPQEKPRAVKFAEQVLVTEIPVRDTDNLPKPFSSPIGVSLCGSDDGSDSDSDNEPTNKTASPPITFSQLLGKAFPDDDDDPEFSPDDPLALDTPTKPIHRPRRRIVAKRLDVPLEQIMPAKHANKLKPARATKRPRSEASRSAPPPSSTHHREEPDNLQANGGEHPLKETSHQHKQSKHKYPTHDNSSPVRLKNKRKRVSNADDDIPDGKRKKATNVNSRSNNESNGAVAQLDKPMSKQHGKSGKIGDVMQPHTEIVASDDNTDRPLITFSSADTGGTGAPSLQNGHTTGTPNDPEAASIFVANGYSKTNESKENGLHDDDDVEIHQDKRSDTADDKDIDDIFGELVKRKAAKRVYKEKMSLQKKRAREENTGLRVIQRSKKKSKKGPTRYTKDGLRIMTFEEIAADQPPGLNGDCPFDCSCCF